MDSEKQTVAADDAGDGAVVTQIDEPPAPATRHVVIDDATGRIINIVMWNGVDEWHPGGGLSHREARAGDEIYSEPAEGE